MKPSIPTGSESIRPFPPARDFETSNRFYETPGFTKVLAGEAANFRIGTSSFVLQRHYQREWAENFMMQLMMDDLDAWWAHVTALDLPATFGVPVPKPPTMQTWGLRIAQVIDPSDVL